MKLNDILKFGLYGIKKHKLRFVINCLVLVVLLGLMFFMVNTAFSIKETAKQDLINHLNENDNVVKITYSPTISEGLPKSIYAEEEKLITPKVQSLGECTVDKYYSYQTVSFLLGLYTYDMNIKDIKQEEMTLIKGRHWDEVQSSDNYIWITEDIYEILEEYITQDMLISGKTEDKIISFKFAGVVKGSKFNIYANSDFLLAKEIHWLSHVDYYFKLDSKDNYNSLINTCKTLNKFCDSMPDYIDEQRMFCKEYNHYQEIEFVSAMYALACVALIVYFIILTIGVLKNNAVINIFDRIKTYSIMRCMGMENNKLVSIAMVESCLTILIGFAGSLLVGLILGGPASSIANVLLNSVLYDNTCKVFVYAWWMPFVLAVLLIALTMLHFSISLTKSLKRKNLLQSLKRE